jgi:FkbM family methyltransferase
MILNKLTDIRILKRIENNIKSHLGKIATLRIDYKCPKSWYGNDYGGFYINPMLLTSNSIVYSFGIGQDISFDLEVIKHHQCQIFGFDPTPKSIEWIRNQNLHSLFRFESIGIGKTTGRAIFKLPKDEKCISASMYDHRFIDSSNHVEVQLESFQDISDRLHHTYIDVLKMDIEGAEYDAIDNILNSKIYIKQILLEIHERFFDDGKKRTEILLQKLRNKGYRLFAISDSYQELSFIKIS